MEMMELMDRLEANSIWEPNSGCRIWEGAASRDHGVVKVHGKPQYVHRLVWEMVHGPIAKGLWVLHNCGLGLCMNVNHLRLGTRDENATDRHRHGGYIGRTDGGRGLQSQSRIQSARAPKFAQSVDAPPDQSDLRRILAYDPDTGDFRWRLRSDRDHSWNMRHVGGLAGSTLPIGYRYVNIRKKLLLAHRLAWLWMTGQWPVDQIDHINGDRVDNRWCNLRLATQKQNSAN
jgi:hypothetical protein